MTEPCHGTARTLRAAVIGGRRARHGIGEYVARELHRAGARVVAVCTRSSDSAQEAVLALEHRYSITATGFVSVERMLADTLLDVVAVCSPARAHREHLLAVASAPLHVLCDKPFWWSDTGVPRTETERLADHFRGRILRLITQWPYTLDAFRSLHGDVGPVRRFAMLMSPANHGRESILDSIPHLISMLQALVGRGMPAHIRWSGHRRLTFGYGEVEVEFLMDRSDRSPRPAWYAINDFRIERIVDPVTYAFAFAGAGRVVAVQDPLALVVRDFLDTIRRDEPGARELIVEGMDALGLLYAAAPA